ncbi:MAG: hypothetical protein QOE24_2864 [Frankiales bacterium]|jgi:hypothetical protein|nr:hypothetical protein [Frankiales bacterium]MDX6210473.1 hypothetical protein [Frankiales bacterium]
MIREGPAHGWGRARSGKDSDEPMSLEVHVSRLSSLTGRSSARATAEGNLATLRGRASDAAEVIGPRVHHARELAEPYMSTARERVEPYVSTARERVEPYVTTARERITPVAEQAIASGREIARDKIKPAYEHAAETTRETVAPAVAAALATAAANTAPARTEAKIRSAAALAALRGDVPARRSRRWPLLAGVLVLGAALGAAAAEAVRRFTSGGLAVSPTPLRPSSVTIPESITKPQDAPAKETPEEQPATHGENTD